MSYNLGTATGRILIDGSGAQKGFAVATEAANIFYQAVQSKLDSVERLGDNLIKIGAAGSAGLGLAVRSAATFEAGLSAVKAVSGATVDEMADLREAALRIGKDTSFSASEAVDAIGELSKAGVSTADILNGAADATVALAAAGELDLPRAAEIASSAINNFALSGKELPHVADLIAGAANASAIDVGDFGFSLSQAGAVANLTGLKFDDLAVAIAEMGQAGIKGSDAGTSIKTFLTNLIPTTDKQKAKFEELGLQTVKVGADFSKLTKAGLKPASSSLSDVTKSLEAYVAKTGGAQKGTKENAKEAQELGIQMGIVGNSFFDAQGKMLPFREIQEKLSKATKNLSKEQKLMALDTLFGSDAIRASAVFADKGAAGFDKMSGAIGKVKAADVAKTRLDNLNGSIEQMKGSFETAQIIIGEVFLPVLRKIVDGITSVINIFNNLPAGVQKAIAVMLGLGSVMSLMTGIVIKLAFALGPMLLRFLGFAALRQIFSIFTVGFGAMRSGVGVFAALGAAGGRLGIVFSRFARIGSILFTVLSKFPRMLAILRTASTLAFGPWGIAIAALVAGAILLYKNFKPFHDLVDSLAGIIKGAVMTAFNLLLDVIEQVQNGFNGVTSDEGGFWGFLLKLGAALQIAVQLLKDLGRTFMEVVVPALQEAGGQIMQALQEAWTQIAAIFQESVMPALRELGAAFVELLPHLQELWIQLQPVLKFFGILAAIIIGVVLVSIYALIKVILLLLPYLIQIGVLIVKDVIGALSLLAKIFVATLTTVIQFAKGIIDALGPAIDGTAQIIRGLVDIVKGVFNVLAGLFTGDWKRMWDGAKQIVSGFKDAIVGLINGMVSTVVNIVKLFVKTIIDFFKNLYNTLVGHSIVPDMVNAIIRYIATLPGRAASALGSLGSAILGKVRSAMSSMLSGIQSGIGKVVSAIRGLPGKMKSALGNLGGILLSAGRQIIQGLLNGINSMIGAVKSKLNSLTGLIPDWKGPLATDKKLLTENGIAIIQSLLNAFQAQMPQIESFLRGLTQLIGDGVTVPPTWTIDNGVVGGINAGKGTARKRTPAEIARDAILRRGKADSDAKGNMNAFDTSKAVVVNNNWTVNNPVAEKTSVTTVREATRRASLGVLA